MSTMKSTPDGLEDQLYYEDNQLPNHIHKNSSIHSYFRQLRHILELKNKKMKKITPKKSSLFSILFFLELLSENPEAADHLGLNPSKPKHFIRFYSVGVFYLLLSVPTFLCSRTLSTSEKLNFGGGLESTSSVEWKPRGTAPPQCESSK